MADLHRFLRCGAARLLNLNHFAVNTKPDLELEMPSVGNRFTYVVRLLLPGSLYFSAYYKDD